MAASSTRSQIPSQLTVNEMSWIDDRLEQIKYYIAIRERGVLPMSRPATPEDASYEADDDDDDDDIEDNEDDDASETEEPVRNASGFPSTGGKGTPDYAGIDYSPPSILTPKVAAPRTGPRTTAKRVFSEISFDEDEPTPASPSPKKQKRGTSERPSSNDDLSPLVTVDERLARSMDHSTKLPDANIRLACPYPAPYDILAASQMKYQSLYAEIQAKAGSGNRDRVAFTVYEDDQIIRHMLNIRLDASIPETEKRFEVISQRLAADPNTPVPRSKMALKNMWCRIGRARSGFDERKAGNQDLEKVANKNPKYAKR